MPNKSFSTVFHWQFNDSPRVWCNGWIVDAPNSQRALAIGRRKLHKLASSAIMRSKLRLAYVVKNATVEPYLP